MCPGMEMLRRVCGEGTQCSFEHRVTCGRSCSGWWRLFGEDKALPALCTGVISKEKSFPSQANCSLTGAIEARGVSLFASQCQVHLQAFECSLPAAA